MKFLATASLLLACAASVKAETPEAPSTLASKYEQVKEIVSKITFEQVQPANIVACLNTGDSDETIFCTTRRLPNLMDVLVPRNPHEVKANGRRRKRRALKYSQERRHLEGAKFAAPKKGSKFEKAAYFEIVGIPENSKDHTLVLKDSKGAEYSLPLTGDGGLGLTVEDGTIEIEANPAGDVNGKYTFRFDYIVTDGEKETKVSIAGTSIEFTPTVIRRSGGGSSTTPFGEGPYPHGGQIQGASGRIYFESNGVDYACTGTVVKDNKSGRSLIMTAAHCVYDDIDGKFGSNVIFIPNRDAVDQTGQETTDIHRQCHADICGCWYLTGGVVHDKWLTTDWPERLDYDYGFYIVDDEWSHEYEDGSQCGSDALDIAVDELTFAVGVDLETKFVTGLGYSLEHNPDFRYCQDTVTTNQPVVGVDTYWLDGCGLTGGSSGGPWLMDFDKADGSGKIVTVNSWSYSGSSGMGGPIIDESEARCLINAARSIDFVELYERDIGEQGEFVSCYDRPCIPEEEAVRKLRGGRKLCED